MKQIGKRDMKELYDKDMREALFSYFEDSYSHIRFLEEFSMGKSRADAIMISENEIVGFELKSDRDSLVRLKSQIPDYDKYYDRNYLVVGEHFEKKSYDVLPSHWGIIKVFERNGSIQVEQLRPSVVNPADTLKKQMEFLWRNELIHIVKEHKLGGVTNKNKHKLMVTLYDNMSREELKQCLLWEMMEREYPKIYTFNYSAPVKDITFITDGYVIKKITLNNTSSRYISKKNTLNACGESGKENKSYENDRNVHITDLCNELSLHKEIKKQFDEYFSGKRKQFELPLEKQRFNAFTRKVYNALCEIPYGETKSYGEIAKMAGKPKAYRAVGSINNKNPYPIVIPCHRVIGANGKLTGYGGGLEFKEMLLELEKKYK